MSKESFVFYFHWARSIRQLRPEDQLEVFNAIVQMAETGHTCKLSPVAHAVIAFLKPIIEKDRSKYERMCARNRSNASVNGDGYDEPVEDEDDYDYLTEEADDEDEAIDLNEESHPSHNEKVNSNPLKKNSFNQKKKESVAKKDKSNGSSNTIVEASTVETATETVQDTSREEPQTPDILIFDDIDDLSGNGSQGSSVAPLNSVTPPHQDEEKLPKVVTTGKTFSQSQPLGSDNDNEYDNDYDYETSKKNGSLCAPKGYERFKFDFVQPPYRAPFLEWLAYKRERREKYTTQRTLKACYNNLVKLSGGSPAVARKMVEQSEANNWAGLFKLKNSDNDGDKRSNNTVGAQQAVRAGQDAFGRVMQRISSRQHPGQGAEAVLAGGAAAVMP